MSTLAYFGRMARYNQWMNERIYECCAGIPDAVRKEDRRAFFKSIHGTLNHILLADMVWLGRFSGRPFAATGLDQEVAADFAELRRKRERTDREILSWVEGLTEKRLASTFTFSFGFGPERKTLSLPLWQTAMQLFNHQTHHRGQVTTLMMQVGCDPGVTDILKMPDASEA